MKFGPIPLAEAQGAILAHSLSTPRGAVKKGRKLGSDEIAKLAEAGFETVIAARLEPSDIGEDEAAGRIARALAGQGIEAAEPFTGRANLMAQASGLVVIAPETIHKLNAIDEAITVATVEPFERVTSGQMLATVKIIPFAASTASLISAEEIARTHPIALQPFAKKRAGLVLTRLPATKTTVLDNRKRVTADRLAALGSELAQTIIVSHQTEAVRTAILDMQQAGLDPILVFAASAIVDRADVIPAAVVAAGGEIIHLGMPVDPGNLLLTARLGTTDVLGMPSCAASPKINGFDWVLERRIAGLPAGREEIARMGLGGLLKEIVTRPQPRTPTGTRKGDGSRVAPRVACIILAAGRSSRMGATNKLEELWHGTPIVRHVADAVLESSVRPVIAVTGHRADTVRPLLQGLDIRFVHNPDYALGLSTSLRAGLDALPHDIDAVLIALGDMPRISAKDIGRLIAAFSPKEGRSIIVPAHDGKRGNPVLWAAQFIQDMRNASGDSGAKHLLGSNAEQVVEVDFATDAPLTDIDTPAALARLREADPID